MERLLKSLNQHLIADDFPEVTVVDDRTDARYLELLQQRFPWVSFGSPSDWSRNESGTLPYVEAWRRAVSNCSEPYVLILEDDQWLCEDLNLDEALRTIELNAALSLSMSAGLQDLTSVDSFPLDDSLYVGILPKVLARRNFTGVIGKLFVSLLTAPTVIPRKISSVLILAWPSVFRELWTSLASVNPMAGAIFLKDHWLHLWSGQISWINENVMISRTIGLLRNKSYPKNAILQSIESHFKTSYVSTASLTLGTGVDWPAINNEISHAWSLGQLEAPEPCDDWGKDVFAQIISRSLGAEMASAYISWCRKFELMHRRL